MELMQNVGLVASVLGVVVATAVIAIGALGPKQGFSAFFVSFGAMMLFGSVSRIAKYALPHSWASYAVQAALMVLWLVFAVKAFKQLRTLRRQHEAVRP